MTTSKLYLQNFYEPVLSSATVAATGDVTFTLSVTPTYTKGFITFSPSNSVQREIMYFDDVVGSTVYVKSENRGLGGTSAKAHTQGEIVAMKDVAEIFNFFSNNISNAFYVEKKGGLNVNVWGGSVFYNQAYQAFSDTALTLTASATNYIQYDYPTNTISASLVDGPKTKAIVVTNSTTVTSITYQVAKESYIDFTVSLNTALPPQAGNVGKYLGTDNTNAAWYNFPSSSETIAGVVEKATDAELLSGTTTGGTGVPLTFDPSQLALYKGYGDGSDGDVTITTPTTLTRDMFYNNLTINTGGYIIPAGYMIFVRGTMTNNIVEGVRLTGNTGTNASGSTGGAGATALATGTLGAILGGATGASGATGAGAAGTAGTAIATSYAAAATNSVAGGAGGGNPAGGGSGGALATITARGTYYNTFLTLGKMLALMAQPGHAFYNSTAYGALPSSGAGGAGAGNGFGTAGGGGGGSGGNGGIIYIAARVIAGSGTVSAKGGAGGNGAQAPNAACGGGGGGSGGSGGVIIQVYNTGTPFTTVVTGGAGGTGGAANTTGNAGTAGSTGTSGVSININA